MCVRRMRASHPESLTPVPHNASYKHNNRGLIVKSYVVDKVSSLKGPCTAPRIAIKVHAPELCISELVARTKCVLIIEEGPGPGADPRGARVAPGPAEKIQGWRAQPLTLRLLCNCAARKTAPPGGSRPQVRSWPHPWKDSCVTMRGTGPRQWTANSD